VPSLVLYGNRESGHSYKARLALTLLALPHEYRPVDITLARGERPAEFRAASRFGEVPVLLVDGVPLAQSDAILAYLARLTGRLGGALEPHRIDEWLFWEANRIGFSLPNLRFAKVFAPETSPEVVAWLAARVTADLDRLEDELARREFLLGAALTVADIACCAYMFWPEQAGIDLAAWRNVSRWLAAIRAMPGWQHPDRLLAGS
jgi:glutathione S-transferase